MSVTEICREMSGICFVSASAKCLIFCCYASLKSTTGGCLSAFITKFDVVSCRFDARRNTWYGPGKDSAGPHDAASRGRGDEWKDPWLR